MTPHVSPPAPTLLAADAAGLPFIRNLPLQPAWLAAWREEALEPDLPIIDPHHHFWDHEGGYLLDDLLADMASDHNVVATVFVQCAYAYRTEGSAALRPVGETERVAAIAQQAVLRGLKSNIAAGIVSHANLGLGDEVDAVLQAHIDAGGGRFRGVRHITTWHADFNASMLGRPPANLMQRASFRRGLARLAHYGLSFDAWLYHSQIGQLADLARAVPEVPIVLNHVGAPLGVGPYVGKRHEVFAAWRAAMKDLAACPNVHIKLGGLAMAIMGFEFHKAARPPTSLQLAEAWAPYFHTCIEFFGVQRCMYESNFPVDKGMCSYGVLWNAFKRISAGASSAEKAWLFRDSARAFYRLEIGAE